MFFNSNTFIRLHLCPPRLHPDSIRYCTCEYRDRELYIIDRSGKFQDADTAENQMKEKPEI